MMRQKKKSEPGKPIAVIEEIANNIYSMRFVLESLGYEVRSYSAGEDYVPALVGFSPQLIMVDMMIPQGGAYEAIRSIRKGRLRKVPILAVTADAMVGDEADIYRYGAQDVLPKPYAVADLKRKLEKWLGAHAL